MILTIIVALVFCIATGVLGCTKKKATKLEKKSGESQGNLKKSNIAVNKKSSEVKEHQFPQDLPNAPLAPTQADEKSGKSQGNLKRRKITVNKKSSELRKHQFTQHLLNVPLAPTQAEEDAEKIKSKKAVEKKQEKEKEIKVDQERQHLLPYPEVKLPTLSERRRRLDELEKEKKEKVASGFYQSYSDEDDTLEQVESLKEEFTERSRKRSAEVKKAQSVEEVSAKEDVNDFFKEAVKGVGESNDATEATGMTTHNG